MTKAYSIFLTVLFTVFIGSVLVISALLPKEEFSEMENRFLQKPPELSIETVKNGKFMENAEKYVSDHIAGRDLWVAAKAWGERLSGKQENNEVYFAAQDTLINRVEEPDGETWEQLDQNLEYLDQLVSNAGVPVYFGLIPSAAQVWHDRLPDGAPTAGEAAIIETLYSRTAARTVDLLSVLSAHSGEELYYRTDHHWTSLGAYYGYTALMEAMGMEPVDLADYERTTVTDQFYGTIFSASGVRWVAPDRIDTYIPADGVKVTSYFDGTPSQGSLYVDSYQSDFCGLCFTNLVDFDALWGHRRNPIGYGEEIERFDKKLGELLPLLKKEDLLMITADHGNDPTYKGTDHTREQVPLLLYSPSDQGSGRLPTQDTFAVIGATIADNFGVQMPANTIGTSLLPLL